MANIQYGQKRKNNTRPIYIKQRYTDADNIRRQKLIPCKSEEEAKALLPMVAEAESSNREFIKPAVYPKSYNTESRVPGKMTVRELLELYVADSCSKGKWKPNELDNVRRLIRDHINPYIGDERVAAVNPTYIQNYYNDLRNQKESPGNHKSETKKNSPRKIEEIQKILSPAFYHAVLLGEITVSPITRAINIKHSESAERPYWRRFEAITLLSQCDDPDLKAMIAVMTGCTLRTGELTGLMWDCVHIPENSSPENPAYIEIKRGLTRYNPDDMEATGYKAYLVLPNRMEGAQKQLVVMESLKTSSSVRKIFIGKYLTELLKAYKKRQNAMKEEIGNKYHDFGFVFANRYGYPYTSEVISKHLHKYAETVGLSKEVTFYSLRATGTTIKAKIAAMHIVEADTGHSPRGTTRKYYVHAEEEDRIKLAYDMDTAFFDDVRKAETEKQNHIDLDR